MIRQKSVFLLVCAAICAADVRGALDGAVAADGEKPDSPLLLAQLLLWKKAPALVPADESLPSHSSPPKAMRPPIPTILVEEVPTAQREQQQEPERQQPPSVLFFDQMEPAQESQNRPQTVPDYYDAVREEDQRQRQAAETSVNRRIHAAPIVAVNPSHDAQPEMTAFAPKTIFINPPAGDRSANGDRVVAAMVANNHGGFTPLDELVSSSMSGDLSARTRMARFSVPPLSDTPTDGVLYVIDRDSGAEHETILRPVDVMTPNAHIGIVSANEDMNGPIPESQPEKPFWVFSSQRQPEPIKPTDYEDEMRQKGIDEAKLLQKKRAKPLYNAVPSQEPIEVVEIPDDNARPKFLVDSDTQSETSSEAPKTTEGGNPEVVPLENAQNETKSKFGDEPPTTGPSAPISTKVIDGESPAKVVDGESSSVAEPDTMPEVKEKLESPESESSAQTENAKHIIDSETKAETEKMPETTEEPKTTVAEDKTVSLRSTIVVPVIKERVGIETPSSNSAAAFDLPRPGIATRFFREA